MLISASATWRRLLSRQINLPSKLQNIRIGKLPRLLWLLFAAACVSLTTVDLFASAFPQLPDVVRYALMQIAWLALAIAWNQQRAHFRNFARRLTIALLWSTILFTSVFRCFALTSHPEDDRPTRDYYRLHDAILSDNVPAVRGMLARGVDPNFDADYNVESNFSDSGLLATAVHHHRLEPARLLIRHGADLSANASLLSMAFGVPDEVVENRTPTPVKTGRTGADLPMMRLLLQSGLHVNDDDKMSSALWAAVNSDSVDSVEFLLQHGANPNTREDASSYLSTPDGNMTVLHLARCRECDPIARLLKHAGATE